MATSYDEIYNRCARYLTDFELAAIPQEDADAMFHEWMIGAIAKFRKCKNNLSDRDDELRTFNVDLLDIEKEILAVMMAREWLAPQSNSALLTKQVFAGKEEKYYSQAQHLSSLETRDEKLKLEAQKLHRDYTYGNNSYLEG